MKIQIDPSAKYKLIVWIFSLSAANAILYKCPLIGDQVLPKEEMKEAIRSFLYSQLGEEPGLTSCLIIHTLNKEQEKTKLAVDTLCKVSMQGIYYESGLSLLDNAPN